MVGLDVMRLSRRRKHYRPNIFAMIVMTVITVLLVCALASRTSELERRAEIYEARITSLNKEIAEADALTEALEEERIFMQSSQYVVQMAKNVLGLVEPGEMVVAPQQ